MQVASRLQYGCTWINTHFMLVNEMPHGGMKMSGYGKDLSIYALEDYTVVRHVMVNFGWISSSRSGYSPAQDRSWIVGVAVPATHLLKIDRLRRPSLNFPR